MGEYANSYYNKYLTLNAPDPHKWMAENYKDSCKRLVIDYNAID